MVYTETDRQVVAREFGINRGQFGPGVAGEIAFQMISSRLTCEGFDMLNDGNGGERVRCEKPAVETVDFDAPKVNDLVQIPSCAEHKGFIETKVIEDCLGYGITPSFGRNGWGRS